MKKKGFTLIELLAVVIILAVIALIATPIVLDVVEDARKSANKSSAEMVLSAANNYFAESLLDKSKREKLDGETNLFYELQMQNKPKEGQVFINEEGEVALVLKMGKNCYVKSYNTQIEEYDQTAEECDLSKALDSTAPTLTFELIGTLGNNGWYKETSPKVILNVEDDISGYSYYKWCQGDSCTPNNTKEELEIEVQDGLNTQVCVMAYDKAGNTSEKKCTDLINVDTTLPEITGLETINIKINEQVDLKSGVVVDDKLSGIELFEVTELDTSKAGEYTVIYTVVDKAGNEVKSDRFVYIDVKGLPEVEFIVEDGILNEDNWANEDFYVTVNVKDNSGHGIKEVMSCTATDGNSCTPNENNAISPSELTPRLITMEGSYNQICVIVTDNYNQTSPIICSDVYKLDKTNPTLELDKYTYIEGFKGWTYANGAYEQDGIVYLSETIGSKATSKYFDVGEEEWYIVYDAYVKNAAPNHYPNGGVYNHVNYYDNNYETFVSNTGYDYGGWSKTIPLNTWVTHDSREISYGTNAKYIDLAFIVFSDLAVGPVQIKNFKLTGQLYQDFYNITVSNSDTNGIEEVKYALGDKDKSYFENNGTIVTTNEITVTENGTYTFYVKDTTGNVTIDKVVIDKIDKNSPIITTKQEPSKIILGKSNDIKSYFNINQNGEAPITQTTCINKTTGSVITNTSELTAGTHEIECSVLKANNKDAKATITLNIVESLKCVKATVLHTEICNQTEGYCNGSGYTTGSTITYGSLGTDGTLKSGDAFDCDVNGDGVYDAETERFYYVSDLYNTTNKSFDSNYAVLIYYNNTYKGVANNTSSSLVPYDSSNENWRGPRTSIANLPTTSQWSKVSLSNTSRAILTQTGTTSTTGGTLPTAFSYAGYAARLLTAQEINKACGITAGSYATGELDSCNYLMENTKYSSSSMGTYGYWLETPTASYSSYVWNVNGDYRYVSNYSAYNAGYSGVRPAIEVLKEDIEY